MTKKVYVIKRKNNNVGKTYAINDFIRVFDDEKYTYTIIDNLISITKYNGSDEDVNIIYNKKYTYLPKTNF